KGPRSCFFSPDGQWLASAHSDGLRLWAASTGKEFCHLRLGYTWSVAIHPSGRSLLSSGEDGVQQWPIEWRQEATGRHLQVGPPRTLNASESSERAALSGDGRTLAFFNGDRVRVLDVESWHETAPLIEPQSSYVALSPNGKWGASGPL